MSRGTQQVVTFTARETAELLSAAPDERPLNADEIAGPTLATLISAGTELNSGYLGEHFPTPTGYTAVFRVDEVGSEVTGIQAGDRVFCMGAHRSWQRVRSDNAVRVPDALAPEEALFCRMMSVSMSTLTTTTARPPEKVLVTGLGLVGHLAARIFAACGYEVIACDPSAARRELASRAGIARVVAEVPVDDPSIAGHVGLVVECSGHEGAALQGCAVVRKRGEVVLVGCPWHKYTDLTAHQIVHAVFHRYAVLRSGWEWEVPRHPADFHTNSIYGNIEAALRWIADGRISVQGLWASSSPADAQQVFQDLLHARWPSLGAVFDWTLVA